MGAGEGGGGVYGRMRVRGKAKRGKIWRIEDRGLHSLSLNYDRMRVLSCNRER